MELPADALDTVAAWLPAQRWFAGKGGRTRVVGFSDVQPLGSSMWNTTVSVDVDGEAQRYQVPLCVTDTPGSGVIGPVGRGFLHDGARREDVMVALLSQAHWVRTPPPPTYRPLAREQSHSAGVFGERVFVKLYRRLTTGLNPDVEVPVALERAGSREVALLWGWATLPDGTSSALLQEYLVDAVDGWTMAPTVDAQALGRATARFHADLAQVFPTATIDGRALRDRLRTRIRAAAIDDVHPLLPGLLRQIEPLGDLGAVPVQRVHGDYHLGQVLHTADGWRIVDFEGEPGRPLAERRSLDSAWRDVAGMLRSFDYAGSGDGEDFLAGYAHQPPPGLLTAFLIDKAVYEVAYESRNRPDWVRIPLAALRRLVDA